MNADPEGDPKLRKVTWKDDAADDDEFPGLATDSEDDEVLPLL